MKGRGARLRNQFMCVSNIQVSIVLKIYKFFLKIPNEKWKIALDAS